MTIYRFIIPVFILTISCNTNKTIPVIPPIDTPNVGTVQKITEAENRNKIDSIYLVDVERVSEDPYYDNFDTTIKGGYSISYYHDKEDQYLIYKKGNKVIDTIGSCSLGLPYKNLGYVGADFDKTFIFVNSFGSGNPNYISLVDKETGRNLIPGGSAWIDVDTSKQVLLYSKSAVPFEKDSMTLFDTRTLTQKDYAFPKEMFREPERLNRIELVNVTNKGFTITYTYKNWTIKKQKHYSR